METTTSSSHSSALPNPNIPSTRPLKNSAAFKRENRRKRKESKRFEKLQFLLQDWAPLTTNSQPSPPIIPSTSVAEWPSNSLPDESRNRSSWDLITKSPSLARPPPPPPSADALAQKSALGLCREFFAAEFGSDEEEEDCDGSRNYDFFKGIFDKDAILREFYRRELVKGRFFCLACGGIGEKMGKEFVGSVAVAQHANFVSKTRGMMVHRAYGRVVSELLGLEIGGFKDEDALKGGMEDVEEDGVYLMVGVEMNVDDDS